ncbi:MAG: hypothetical protein R3A47_00350 [Polyangiales bacterium]
MLWTKPRIVTAFTVLLILFTWPASIYMVANQISWTTALGRALGVWNAFAVLLVSLLMMGPVLKQPIRDAFAISFRVNRWFFVGWLLPVAIAMLALAIASLFDQPVTTTVAELVAHKRSAVPEDQLATFDAYLKENPIPSPLRLLLMGLPAALTFNLLPSFAE